MTTQRINKFFDTLDNYSILNWLAVLEFATKKDLELKELKQLDKKSEEFRQHWNTPLKTIEVVVSDGVQIDIPKTRNSLEISRDDVVPDIRKLIEQHRREAKSKNIKHNKESIPLEVAVV